MKSNFKTLTEKHLWTLDTIRRAGGKINAFLLYRLYHNKYKEPPKSLVLLLWELEDMKLISWHKPTDTITLIFPAPTVPGSTRTAGRQGVDKV